MILIDTTPLVALCDPTDGLHARALADLDRLRHQPLALCEPVLTEAVYLLPQPAQRLRLAGIAGAILTAGWAPDDPATFRRDVFAWLARYAEHEPDWADATLVVATAATRRARVWTYDAEFRTTWRRPDGTRVPLAPR